METWACSHFWVSFFHCSSSRQCSKLSSGSNIYQNSYFINNFLFVNFLSCGQVQGKNYKNMMNYPATSSLAAPAALHSGKICHMTKHIFVFCPWRRNHDHKGTKKIYKGAINRWTQIMHCPPEISVNFKDLTISGEKCAIPRSFHNCLGNCFCVWLKCQSALTGGDVFMCRIILIKTSWLLPLIGLNLRDHLVKSSSSNWLS